jgi:hypothetical protein
LFTTVRLKAARRTGRGSVRGFIRQSCIGETRSIEPMPRQPAPSPQQIIPVKSAQPMKPEIEQPLEPMDRFRHCDLCLEMVATMRLAGGR